MSAAVMDDLVGRHALVLADVERGRVASAAGEVRVLIGLANRAGLRELVPRLRLTMAWIELDRGRLAACARQLARARTSSCAVDLAKCDCLGGLLRCASGAHSAAVDELDLAIPVLRRVGERRWLANALVGRGTALGYLHRLTAADSDFETAGRLYGSLGERVRSAACVHNRGFVA
ncbi:MAG TPA: hypothetical protein VH352_15805, partial [Pseudonocardiaceae bacterium]|nr:hypothetical protein [Pseudonocardiaceae bacterium]